MLLAQPVGAAHTTVVCNLRFAVGVALLDALLASAECIVGTHSFRLMGVACTRNSQPDVRPRFDDCCIAAKPLKRTNDASDDDSDDADADSINSHERYTQRSY